MGGGELQICINLLSLKAGYRVSICKRAVPDPNFQVTYELPLRLTQLLPSVGTVAASMNFNMALLRRAISHETVFDSNTKNPFSFVWTSAFHYLKCMCVLAGASCHFLMQFPSLRPSPPTQLPTLGALGSCFSDLTPLAPSSNDPTQVTNGDFQREVD